MLVSLFLNRLIWCFQNENDSNQVIKAKLERINKRFMVRGLQLSHFVDTFFCSVEIEKM